MRDAARALPYRRVPAGGPRLAETIPFIGPASASLARYDGTLAAISNPRVLLAPLTTREAVLSSRIQGTQTTMGEVLEFEAGREPASAARREDIHEVLNYRAAMRRAEDMMRDLPLCQRVVREAHGVLLAHVRGQDKAPGEYRRAAVWIGPPGSTVDEAKFVPVDAQRLPDAMSAWEKYIHADAPDWLVQLAILHPFPGAPASCRHLRCRAPCARAGETPLHPRGQACSRGRPRPIRRIATG